VVAKCLGHLGDSDLILNGDMDAMIQHRERRHTTIIGNDKPVRVNGPGENDQRDTSRPKASHDNSLAFQGNSTDAISIVVSSLDDLATAYDCEKAILLCRVAGLRRC
jgi:hypothetical protein